jgi:hypothetical protein
MPNDSPARVANIDARGRRRRLVGGVVWLVVAAAATAALVALRAREAWYALLVVPFTLAALGWFQARERT